MTLDKLASEAAQQFTTAFGRAPRWISAAPGRVNVIGEHTDYNDGFVLPMAIDRYAVMAADFSPSSTFSLYDASADSTAVVDLSKSITRGEPKWSNYVRGVIAGFQNRR